MLFSTNYYNHCIDLYSLRKENYKENNFSNFPRSYWIKYIDMTYSANTVHEILLQFVLGSAQLLPKRTTMWKIVYESIFNHITL